ncbi:MAG: gamma carbonic anhydrase family protein [Verrucomicrobiota bacterium]
MNRKNIMDHNPAHNPLHPSHLAYFKSLVSTHLDRIPLVAKTAYVAPGAFLAGSLTVASQASIWPGASLRADIAPIVIGEESNVQDNAVVHVATDLGVTIGRRVTVGHSAIIHACTVGNGSLIGMGAVILDGAVIGENCLIGAQSTVLMNAVIPPGSMVVGSPARVVRTLTEEEQMSLGGWSDHYLILSQEYRRRGIIHPAYARQGDDGAAGQNAA